MEFVYRLAHDRHRAWEFEPFKLDYWNLIKIRIKHRDGSVEAAWVYVSKEVKDKYDEGDACVLVPCVLRNSSKNFPLGAYIPLMLDGTSRPTAYMSNFIGGSHYHPDEQGRILEEIYRRGCRRCKDMVDVG